MATATEYAQPDLNRIVFADEQGPNLLEVVLRRKWIIISIVTIGISLGVLYYFKRPPVYESTARVLVKQSAPLTLQTDPTTLFAAKVAGLETQASLIQSPLVVSPAVNGVPYDSLSEADRDLVRRIEEEAGIKVQMVRRPRPGRRILKELPSLKEETDPVGVVLKNLSVEIEKDTEILKLSYKGPRPDDCKTILQEIIASYKEYLQSDRDMITRTALELFSRAKTELSNDLAKLEREYAEFRRQNGHLLARSEDGANMYQARVARIEDSRSELLIQRSQLVAQLKAFQEALAGGADPRALLLLVEQARAATPSLKPVQDELRKAEVNLVQIDQQIDFVKKKLQTLDELQKKIEKGEFLSDDKTAADTELLPLLQEEQRLLERYGENHPDVVSIRKRIELTREVLSQNEKEQQLAKVAEERQSLQDQLAQLLDQRKIAADELARLRSDFAKLRRQQEELAQADGADGGENEAEAPEEQPDHDGDEAADPNLLEDDLVGTSPKDIFSIYMESLQQQIAAIDKQVEELDGMLKEEQRRAKDLIQLEVADSTMQQAIQRKRQLFDIVLKRLEELNLSEDVGGYKATVVSAPTFGGQVAPDLLRSLAVALALSMMAGFGLAYVVELADKRFRTPEDVQMALGCPLLAHVPYLTPKDLKAKEESKVDPVVCVHHRPRSSASEAYRTVRTGLFFSAAGKNAKVVQITSPEPRDGKTTLAANLAVTMAQSGKRVVLIDADVRKPRLHKLFNLERSPGVKEVIRGKMDLEAALQTTEVENLRVLTAGERSRNPAELLASPQFAHLLQQLRDDPNVDRVIIDTPPLLAVSDPASVAPLVDGVLLVMRVDKTWSRESATRSTQILKTVNGQLLGVVVNAVGAPKRYDYAAYKSQYRYKYRYRYKYGYDYRYYYGYRYQPYGYGYADPEYGEEDETEDSTSGASNNGSGTDD